MNKLHLDTSWKSWLQENISRKCDPEELLGILLQNNFALESIEKSMGKSFPAHSPLIKKASKDPARSLHQELAEVRLTQPDSKKLVQKVLTSKLQLYTIDHFLSGKECDAIVKLMRKHLRPSTITIASPDKYFRTSQTCDLSLFKNKTIAATDKKIAEALGIRLPYSEGIQAQHYDVGQEFKQHTDYFQPETDEYREHAGKRGNRTWTFMIYLNDVEEGGETRFYEIDYTITPQKGRAVVWNNLHPDGSVNYDTLHAGLPIKKGHKDIITKWFREKGTGPMFFN
jgi:prolyl 4-hydroxylase